MSKNKPNRKTSKKMAKDYASLQGEDNPTKKEIRKTAKAIRKSYSSGGRINKVKHRSK